MASPTVSSFLVRRRVLVLVLVLIGAVAAGAFGGDVQSWLKSGGFEDPDAESTRAAAVLADDFGAGDPDVVFVVTAPSGSVDDPSAAAAGAALADEVRGEPGVVEVASYWGLGNPPPLRSTDGSRALLFVRLEGDDTEVLESAGALREQYEGAHGGLEIAVGGEAAVFDQVNEVVESDLVLAEAIAFPITLVLLVLVFGSVVAALLPLAIGGLAIIGTFATLEVIARATDVSIFALNFTTAMGLGLAIDYSLLVVSRFREELDQGHEPHQAVVRTLRTAGRTVVFSAGTVAASLVALLVFQQYFLRSFAYAGIAVVALAALGATVVLPALLAVLGHNVNRWRVRRRGPADGDDHGIWGRIALTVMRRPVPIAAAAMVFLVALGLPFLRVQLGFPDDRVLPESASTREAGELLRTEFASAESRPTVVVGDVDPAGGADDIDAYAARISTVDGVARVDAATGSYIGGQRMVPPSDFNRRFVGSGETYLSVIPSLEPISPEAEAMVADIRSTDAPFDTLVGGPSAELVDGKAGMFERLPWALAVIALITFVVLFMSFGSVLMPVKAIVLNLLSLTATFGALVWVFQEGHLSDLLGFTATGTLVISMPVLMFIVAFGLSMDYEVFLLSRVKEEWDRTGDDVASVANGLEHTGRIVTAAAVLIAVVFAAFATGGVSFMKMFGIGMTLAVLVDAFIVRSTLVPAFMRLAGRANWWAPAPLRRFHDRYGFSEHVELDGAETRRPAEAGATP